jgi:hypothetical protein
MIATGSIDQIILKNDTSILDLNCTYPPEDGLNTIGMMCRTNALIKVKLQLKMRFKTEIELSFDSLAFF